MAVPRPTPTRIALAAAVAVLLGPIVVPLVPTILDLLVGTFRGFFDVVVPGAGE